MQRRISGRSLIILGLLVGPSVAAVIALEVCVFLKLPISPPLLDGWFIPHVAPFLLGALLLLLAYVLVGVLLKRLGGRWSKTATAIMVSLIVGVNLAYFSAVHYLEMNYDRYQGILVHSTHWAAGFSDSKFGEIQADYSKERVVELLGPPLRTFQLSGREVLVYSDIGNYRSLAEKGFHQRWIVLHLRSPRQPHERWIQNIRVRL